MAKKQPEAPPEGANTFTLPDHLKISRIEGENFKIIETVDITLDGKGNLIPISGANGAGKSSLIDLVWSALGGKAALPDKPIRKGETEMKARVSLGNGRDVSLVVTRKANKSGDDTRHSLKVTTADGSEVQSPQQVLDAIVGMFAFDPLEFTYLKGPEQTRQLLEVVGLADKLDEIEQQTKELETTRRDIGRDRDQYAGALKSMKAPTADTPEHPVNITELTKEYEAAQEQQRKQQAATNAVNSLVAQINRETAEIERLEKLLKEAHEQKANSEASLKKAQQDVKAIKVPDVDAIRNKLQNAELTNGQVRDAEKYREYSKLRQEKADAYDKLTSQIEKLRRAPEDLLKAAEIGIEGLSIVDRVIHLDGVPLEQAATSQQLVVGVKIAMLANPTLRAMFIRDGSLLDSSNLKLIAEMAAGQDYQVIYEKVDETGQVGFVLEHGRVVHEPEDTTNG